MDTWINFESRFKELAPRLQYLRIDDQTGAAGEYWRLSGVNNDREAEQEFQTLCSIAGNHITEVLGGIEAYSIILDNEDPKIRWYRLLKEKSPSYSRDPSDYQIEDDGSKGWIGGGSISRIGEGSANLALWLHANHPITQHWAKTLYQDYGKQIIVSVVVIIIIPSIAALIA